MAQTPGRPLEGEDGKAATWIVVFLASLLISFPPSCLPHSREYVSSKTINKVIQVHDRVFCCMSGSLADAQAVTKAAKFHLALHR